MTTREEGRCAAKSLFAQGMRNAAQAATLTGVAERTMQRYFAKLQREQSLEEAKRPGRPRKNTSTLRRQLAQTKRLSPDKSATFYAARISEKGDEIVSGRTVQRALHELGYDWRLPRGQTLTQAQKRARVAFAEAHREDSWDNRISADECTFNLHRAGNRCWVRASTRDGDDQPSRKRLRESQQKVSVSIVVAIGRGLKSNLGFLPKSWNETALIEVFDRDLYPSLRWSNRRGSANELMLDNDGRHQTAAWLAYVERRRLRPLRPWPSNSPDLNPIENVFAWLKAFVERLAPADEQSLRQAIEAAWRDFPVQFTEHMMDSMSTRLRLVLKHRGGRIAY